MPENIFSSHNNFSAGELTPTIKGRTDLQLYQNGAETLLNFLVLPSGGITRRPGTQYIHLFEQHRTRMFAELKFNTDLNFLVVFEVANREDKRLNIHVFFEDKLIETLTVEDILLNPETFSFVSYQGKLYVCFGLEYPLFVLRPNDTYIVEQSEQIGRHLQQREHIQTERKFVFETHDCTVKFYTDENVAEYRNQQLNSQDQIKEIADNKKNAVSDYYDNLPIQITFKNQYNLTTLGEENLLPGAENEVNIWPYHQIKDNDGCYFDIPAITRKDFDLGDGFLSASFEWNVRLKSEKRVTLKLEVIDGENVIETKTMTSVQHNKFHNISVKAFYVRPNNKIRLSMLNPDGLVIVQPDNLIEENEEDDHSQEEIPVNTNLNIEAVRQANRCYLDKCQYKISKTKKIDTLAGEKITYVYDAVNIPKIPVIEIFEMQKDIINLVAQTISPQLFYFDKSGEKQYYPHQTEENGNDYDQKIFKANKFVVTETGNFDLFKREALEQNEDEEYTHLGTENAKNSFKNALNAQIDQKLKLDLENYRYNEAVATRRLAVHDLISGIEVDQINDKLKEFDQIVEQNTIHCNSIALYNNRLWTFGTRDNIHAVYVSGMGDFNNFNMTYKNLLDVKNPLNPFYVVFNSRTSDPVLWSIPFAGELLIGTTDGIYSIKEGKREHGEFVKVQKEIDIALSTIQPVVLAKSIFIVEHGARKIHNLNFSKEKGGFQLFDVTAYAEHLFTRNIVTMTGLTSPFPMLFVQTGDRNFKLLSFDYDLKLFGWSQHILGGLGAIHAMMSHSGAVYFYILRHPKQKNLQKGAYLEKLSISTQPEKAPYVDSYSRFDAVMGKDKPHYQVIETLSTQLKNTIDSDFEEKLKVDYDLFFEESWQNESLVEYPDYQGDFHQVRLSNKSVRDFNPRTQTTIKNFLRTYEHLGKKRVTVVVNYLVSFIKELDELYDNMIDYFYGFNRDFTLWSFDTDTLRDALTEYQRWITSIREQGLGDILGLHMVITKKDNPQFYLNTKIFRLLANAQETINHIDEFVKETKGYVDHVQRQESQNFFQKRHFAEMLLRLNKLFVLHLLNPAIKYSDALKNIRYYTHLEFDVMERLAADDAEDLQAKMIEKMEQALEKDKNRRVKNSLLKATMIAAFKRLAEKNHITDYDEATLFNTIDFTIAGGLKADVVNDQVNEMGMPEAHNQLHEIEDNLNHLGLLPDDIEIEPDEEEHGLMPYLQTYRFVEGANIHYERVPQRHYQLEDLEQWLTEAIFSFSGVRQAVNDVLACLYHDTTLENISAYRLKLIKLFNDKIKHHEFLQHVRGLDKDELTDIITGDLKQIELDQHHIAALKKRYPDGGAFCVSNHGMVKLHGLKQEQQFLKAVSRIDVGFPYRSVLQSLPFIQDEQVEFVPAQKTNFHVLLRNAKDVTVHTRDIVGNKVIVGITSDMPHPDDEKWYHGASNLYMRSFMESLETPLKSGWYQLEIEGGIDHETTITIVSEQPYPATILKVAAKAKLLQEYR